VQNGLVQVPSSIYRTRLFLRLEHREKYSVISLRHLPAVPLGNACENFRSIDALVAERLIQSSHNHVQCSTFDFQPHRFALPHNLVNSYVYVTLELDLTVCNTGSVIIPVPVRSLRSSVSKATCWQLLVSPKFLT
jgi:hypothetical protein